MPFSHTYALLAGEEDEGYCSHSCSFNLLIMMEMGWYGRKGDAFTGPIFRTALCCSKRLRSRIDLTGHIQQERLVPLHDRGGDHSQMLRCIAEQKSASVSAWMRPTPSCSTNGSNAPNARRCAGCLACIEGISLVLMQREEPMDVESQLPRHSAAN